MNVEKIVVVEPIGQVKIIKNKRSRHMRLRIDANGQAQVSMPTLFPEKNAIQFVQSKTEWIQQQQQKLKSGLTVFSPSSDFQTKFHKLKVVITEQQKLSNQIGNGILQINIPKRFDVQQAEVQQFIRKLLVGLMTYEAKLYLPKRLSELADQHGFQFQKVFVKHVKTRWGSCSSVNNINLNIHLVRLPDHLIDYVLLHELVHTQIKNHSREFWDFLEQVNPGSKAFNKELKKYQVDVF